ncbi:MAG: P-loop NTPase [candidate division Zixibacteria bacterium]|nr:P-loop NTPase [candidate division Zixibacteria bacterium]
MNRLDPNQKNRLTASVSPTVFVSVLSGKGGVGKSLIAFNLAERLAASGNHVLAVDTDRHCGNIHILANLDCNYGLSQYACGMLSLAEAVSTIGCGLDILPAVGSTVSEKQDSVTGLARWINKLRNDSNAYDFVILDHSSGISDRITVLAHACDINLLVLVPELTSIADCYGLYKYLIQTNAVIDCRLLFNRVGADDEVVYIRNKFFALTERFLGKVPGFLGHLPESDTFRKAVAAQTPVSALEADSIALQALNKISQKLVQEVTISPDREASTKQIAINNNLETADI